MAEFTIGSISHEVEPIENGFWGLFEVSSDMSGTQRTLVKTMSHDEAFRRVQNQDAVFRFK